VASYTGKFHFRPGDTYANPIVADDEDKSNARDCQGPSQCLEEIHDTFKLFPKLPLELRLRVWRYTFPDPRFVSLDYAKGNRFYKVPDDLQATRNIKLPPTLQINR
jgi:hypothetical protein